MFGFSNNSVFKYVGVLSALVFVWFTFLSPESANAAQKANYGLIALFASLALYYYSQFKQERSFCENDAMHRRIDDVQSEIGRRIDDVERDLHDTIDSKCADSCKRSR
jgi:hypothetical protein